MKYEYMFCMNVNKTIFLRNLVVSYMGPPMKRQFNNVKIQKDVDDIVS